MKTIFEKSNGADGIGVGDYKLGDFLPAEMLRDGEIGLPQLSELEVLRHYQRTKRQKFLY